MSESTATAVCDVTVAIPTYNGAQRLPKLLEHLRVQLGTQRLRWEVLVVDNNSQDDTAAVVRQYQANWLPEVPLRYVHEPCQGAAFARQTAVRQAQADIVGFLDDDNLPAADWVAEAYAFSQQHPQAGAFGGKIAGHYEAPPPAGFDQVKAYLAIRDHGSEVIAFQPEKLQLPPAASLVIRKQAWLTSVPPQTILSGRKPGQAMLGGEDYEVLLHLHKNQWKILYDPNLKTHHQIPKERLESDYLVKLARSCGLATCQLVLITTPGHQKPAAILRVLLGSLSRLIKHCIRHHGKVRKNLPTACEFAFHLGSFLSPLYVRQW